MALLFVAGIMNLLWVAVISIFVLGEKVLPRGDVIGRVTGVLLAASGVLVMSVGCPLTVATLGADERLLRT